MSYSMEDVNLHKYDYNIFKDKNEFLFDKPKSAYRTSKYKTKSLAENLSQKYVM